MQIHRLPLAALYYLGSIFSAIIIIIGVEPRYYYFHYYYRLSASYVMILA